MPTGAISPIQKETSKSTFIDIDYISTFWLIFFLGLTPFVLTKTGLDWLLGYVWLYTVFCSQSPFVKSPYPMGVWASIKNSQAEILCLTALFSLIVKSKFNPQKTLKIISHISIVLAVIAIPFRIYFDNRWISGVIPNNGMNGIFIAMLLPYVRDLRFLFLGVIAILFSKSSCAYLALLSVSLPFFWKVIPRKWFWGLGVIACSLGYFIMPDFFSDSGRFTGYQFFFNDFSAYDYIFGRGPGSFFSIGAYKQYRDGYNYYNNGYFLWLHSDPLQFIFEYGLLGLVPLSVTFYWVTKKARFPELLSVLAFVVGGIFYYPAHFAPHLLILFFVLKIVASK